MCWETKTHFSHHALCWTCQICCFMFWIKIFTFWINVIRSRKFQPACVWFVNRKLLHQRVEGKEVSQEENFLPKHQRVKDLCQRAEYQTPCQQTGQVHWCTLSFVLHVKKLSDVSENFPPQSFCRTHRNLPFFFFFWNKCRKTALAAAVITNRAARDFCRRDENQMSSLQTRQIQ